MLELTLRIKLELRLRNQENLTLCIYRDWRLAAPQALCWGTGGLPWSPIITGE